MARLVEMYVFKGCGSHLKSIDLFALCSMQSSFVDISMLLIQHVVYLFNN